MNNYELLFIIDAATGDEAKEAIIAKFSAIVENGGGKVISLEKWGTKKFAYTINFKNEGYYVLMNYESDVEATAEIERVMRITDGIVRYLPIRKLAPPPAAAAAPAPAAAPAAPVTPPAEQA